MPEPNDCHLSPPLHFQIRAGRDPGRVLSVREHLASNPTNNPALPLVLITFHPGYAAGSYEDRDYFERLAPLLRDTCRDCCRLRIYTINHPGYDLPKSFKVDRFDLREFSICRQPDAIDQILRWLLLREFADEEELYLLTYGHSMGGLALARTNFGALQMAVARQGRRAHIIKTLSAPALILHDRARGNLGQLAALNKIKSTLGHVPLYETLATSLYKGISPILYRMVAESYSLNPDCSFFDFPRYNPFILLEQGMELLQLNFDQEQLADLLDGSHLILNNRDYMVNSQILLEAARLANRTGGQVKVQQIDSSHNAEREDPELIVKATCAILKQWLQGEVALTA